MTDWNENTCHCGRRAVVNETLGYSRGMCGECDLARCDAYPGECPHSPHPPGEAAEGANRLLLRAKEAAWDEGYKLGHKCLGVDSYGCEDYENPYRSEP